MNIGRTISEIRRQKRIKQKELAKKCNLSVPALCNIEKGKCMPSYKTVEALAEGLGISHGYLLVMSLDEKDIRPEKRPLFKMMKAVLVLNGV